MHCTSHRCWVTPALKSPDDERAFLSYIVDMKNVKKMLVAVFLSSTFITAPVILLVAYISLSSEKVSLAFSCSSFRDSFILFVIILNYILNIHQRLIYIRRFINNKGSVGWCGESAHSFHNVYFDSNFHSLEFAWKGICHQSLKLLAISPSLGCAGPSFY